MLACRGRFTITGAGHGAREQHGGIGFGCEADHRPYGGGAREIRRGYHCIRPLEGLGYSYWAEIPNPNRMLFVKFVDGDLASCPHNVHLVGMGGDLWNDRLVV